MLGRSLFFPTQGFPVPNPPPPNPHPSMISVFLPLHIGLTCYQGTVEAGLEESTCDENAETCVKVTMTDTETGEWESGKHCQDTQYFK